MPSTTKASPTAADVLNRLQARAADVQARNLRDAARFASTEDQYARGLAEGYSDAAALILAEIERIRREVRR